MTIDEMTMRSKRFPHGSCILDPGGGGGGLSLISMVSGCSGDRGNWLDALSRDAMPLLQSQGAHQVQIAIDFGRRLLRHTRRGRLRNNAKPHFMEQGNIGYFICRWKQLIDEFGIFWAMQQRILANATQSYPRRVTIRCCPLEPYPQHCQQGGGNAASHRC